MNQSNFNNTNSLLHNINQSHALFDVSMEKNMHSPEHPKLQKKILTLKDLNPPSYTEEEKIMLEFLCSWIILLHNFKAKICKQIENKLRIIDNILIVLYLTGFITNLLQDIFYFEFKTIKIENKLSVKMIPKPTKTIQIFRLITSITTLIVLIILPFRYKLLDILAQYKGKTPFSTSFSCTLNKSLRITLVYIISILHVPPYLDGFYITFTTLDGLATKVKVDIILILNFLISLRFFFFLSYFSTYSPFANDRADKICKESNVNISFIFTFKSQLKDQPTVTILIIFLASVFIFGYMLRNSEIAFMIDSPIDKFQNWTSIWSGFWCVATAFLTLSHGGFYPQTVFGRIVLGVSLLWGIVLVGVMVIYLSNYLLLSQKEKKIYEETMAEITTNKKKEQAMKIIYQCYKVGKDTEHMNERNKKKNQRKFQMFLKEIIKFNNMRKFNDVDKNKVEIQSLLDKLNTLNIKDIDDFLTTFQWEVDYAAKKIKKARANQTKIKRYLTVIKKLTENLHNCIKYED